jgi:hypothetical protein
MKISIESISLNQEIIEFIISRNLKLESFEISPNQNYDMIISGDLSDLIEYLEKFGYISQDLNKEGLINELDLYLI